MENSKVVAGGFYEIYGNKIAQVREILPYYPDDVVFITIFDQKGEQVERKDFWLKDFISIIGRRMKPGSSS